MATGYANSGIGLPKFTLFGNEAGSISTNPLASATTITPLSYLSIVTGTVSIQNINLPWPFFEGDIILIFTNGSPGVTVTGGTAGIAIALATTPIQYKALTMTYVASTGLWYPSY